MNFVEPSPPRQQKSDTDPDPAPGKISRDQKLCLIFELIVLFVLTPAGVYKLLYGFHIPLFMILPPVFLFFIVFLIIDRNFSWQETFGRGIRRRDIANVLAFFAIGGPAIVLFAYYNVPTRFLQFPEDGQPAWAMVMFLYPLISVTTQEIMFRVYFFQRYRPLFVGDREGAIVLNAALFAFSHIVFQHVTTLVIAFLGGLLLAWRYQTSRSYWVVVLEHTLYGNLIFTVV